MSASSEQAYIGGGFFRALNLQYVITANRQELLPPPASVDRLTCFNVCFNFCFNVHLLI